MFGERIANAADRRSWKTVCPADRARKSWVQARLFTGRGGGYLWDRPRKSWVQKLLVDGRSYDVWGFLYVGSRVWGFLYPTKQLRLVTYSVSALAARCGAFSTLL